MKEFRLNVPPKRLKNSIRIVKMQYLTPQLDQSDMHGNSSIYDFSTSFNITPQCLARIVSPLKETNHPDKKVKSINSESAQ